MNRSATTSPLQLTPALLERFEALLDELIRCHERMLKDTADHRTAIARADQAAIARALAAQQATADHLGEMQRQRALLVRQMVTPAGSAARGGPAVDTDGIGASQIAAAAPEPRRSAILARAERLRVLVVQVTEQRRVVRAAADALLAHMQGLITQIGRHLTHAGVYTRPNAPPSVNQVISALDMTS